MVHKELRMAHPRSMQVKLVFCQFMTHYVKRIYRFFNKLEVGLKINTDTG